MNANELADVLEELHEQDKADGVAHLAMPEAAAIMLRQQQSNIEALEYEVKLWKTQAVQYRAELGFKWTGEIRQWSQE